MSANTLNNRSIGQTILDTFFNDIHSALDGDFVGRGATGIPTSGQNLGTPALPWGTIYGASLNLGGSALDTSKIVSPANRIVSGKVRTTSNQPAFITPNGAAASCVIAGATTNLVLSIGGAAVTVNTDITKSSLTTAPSSNNTAAVNDAALAAAAITKRQGEYGSGGDITIGTVGSNISAIVGKYAAFKIVHSAATEYFIAYVESSTKLSHCLRGFFYDSSLNPINPVAVSNADTITLMKAGFVFMTNDATTVDVSYTFPTYGAVSPTSPATGDYWYDTVNQIWKRYDGASFLIINRTLIGMVVMDSTNCVAARAFDFYAAYDQKNTLDLEISTTATIVQAKRSGSQLSVAGKLIDYGLVGVIPTWVGANNYVTSADYYAAFAISTTYYLYVKDDGNVAITDIAPIWRADLQGWYNRHNPWRCVGTVSTDGSSNWTGLETIQLNNVGPRSTVWLQAANGYGSTNTAIVKWSNILKNYGKAMTLAQSSTLGDSITINEDGLYSVRLGLAMASGGQIYGVSVNSNQLTTSIASITQANIVMANLEVTGGGHPENLTAILDLVRGDVLRAHTDASTIDSSHGYSQMLHVTKISN